MTSAGDQSGGPVAGDEGPALRQGARAPQFRSRNQHGEPVGRDDLLGGPAVIVFFPWAYSSICGGELARLRDDQARYAAAGVRVVAISCDAIFTQRAYSDAEGFDFDLLSDHWPHGEIAKAFGVFDDRAGCALRGTFVLNAEGVITWTEVNGIGEARDLKTLASHL